MTLVPFLVSSVGIVTAAAIVIAMMQTHPRCPARSRLDNVTRCQLPKDHGGMHEHTWVNTLNEPQTHIWRDE